jgi:methylated-DNA-[protein]-cysteine S-methyltransferase
MTYDYLWMDSPVGRLKLIATGKALVAILWEHDLPGQKAFEPLAENEDNAVLADAARQLGEYFAGKRRDFTVALDFKGTPFQKDVWAALLEIPFGETRSYGEIARRIGRPAASRAVGAASGRNPICIIAPCHRVIGAKGALTGFAGGLEAKETLLRIEGHTPRWAGWTNTVHLGQGTLAL